ACTRRAPVSSAPCWWRWVTPSTPTRRWCSSPPRRPTPNRTMPDRATPGRRRRPHLRSAPMSRDPVRIANCSGFYGDRLSAAAEMVAGGPIDVLTGDWLAELTMLILAKDRMRNPDGGYAKTFVAQLRDVLATC